jgi:hypothetical protein
MQVRAVTHWRNEFEKKINFEIGSTEIMLCAFLAATRFFQGNRKRTKGSFAAYCKSYFLEI